MSWKRLLVVTLCAASLQLLGVPTVRSQEDVDAAMERAKRQYRTGNYRGALEELSSVFTMDPERADALYLMGYSHLMLREYRDSVDAFSRAFAADPNLDPRTIYQRPRAPEPMD